MANRHFGKLSEVWKHGALSEILAEERPGCYAETHAGSADYPLTHSPERDYGIFRFLSRSSGDERLRSSAYRHVLDSLPRGEAQPARCPGSPLVALLILGAGADYIFFDTDPASIDSIAVAARKLRLDPQVRAEVRDGPSGVMEAFSGRDGCVHIDPFDPFRSGPLGGPSSVELARMLGATGKTVVYWYGYEEPEHRFWAWDEVATSTQGASRWWIGDVAYAEAESESGIVGCGVLVGNTSQAATTRCTGFGRALESGYCDAALPSGNRGSISFSTRESSRGSRP
jgi:23S rRNA (adenine2030-N6)-methyltransferase